MQSQSNQNILITKSIYNEYENIIPILCKFVCLEYLFPTFTYLFMYIAKISCINIQSVDKYYLNKS